MSGPKLKTYEATFVGCNITLTVEAIDRMDAASRISSQWHVVSELTLTEKP